MATGTGWPFGGPWVGEEIAPRTIVHRTWTIEAGQTLSEPVRFQQPALLRALRNQIYEVGEIKPGETPPAGSAQQPGIRRDVRPLQMSDVVEPVTANRNLQALAIEQIKYPRTLAPDVVMAYGESGRITDLTGLVDAAGKLNWKAPERTIVYALFFRLARQAGRARRTRRRGLRHRSLLARRNPLISGEVRSGVPEPASQGSARVLQRLVRGGRRDGAGQLDAAAVRRVPEAAGLRSPEHLPALLGSGQRPTSAPGRSPTIGRRSRTCCSRRSRRVGGVGPQPRTRDPQPGARFPGEPARSLRRKRYSRDRRDGNSALQMGDLRGECRRAAASSRRKRRHGWANISARRSPTSARPSITSSSPASTTSSITARPTRLTTAPWPGWQFYAAVEFNRRNGLVGRLRRAERVRGADPVVSAVGAGRSRRSAVLPVSRRTGDSRDRAPHAFRRRQPTDRRGRVRGRSGSRSRAADFTYDYISDRQLLKSSARQGPAGDQRRLGTYRVLVLPSSRFIPIDTLEHVLDLARARRRHRDGRTADLRASPASPLSKHAAERFRRANPRCRSLPGARVLQGSDLEATWRAWASCGSGSWIRG